MYTIKKLGDGKESGSGEKGTRCQERKRKKFFESDYQARSQEIKKSIYFIRFLDIGPKKYEYVKGLNGHSEIALYVDTFEEVDLEYEKAIRNGATSVLEPTTEPWGQRTCFIADPEGNLIEIGSWNKSFETKDKR